MTRRQAIQIELKTRPEVVRRRDDPFFAGQVTELVVEMPSGLAHELVYFADKDEREYSKVVIDAVTTYLDSASLELSDDVASEGFAVQSPRLTIWGDWLIKWTDIFLRRRRDCIACTLRPKSAHRYRHCTASERAMGMEYWYCSACDRIQNRSGLD